MAREGLPVASGDGVTPRPFSATAKILLNIHSVFANFNRDLSQFSSLLPRE